MKANKMFLFSEKHQKQKKTDFLGTKNSPFQSFFFGCVVFFPPAFFILGL